MWSSNKPVRLLTGGRNVAWRSGRGFTLLELTIVVIIISLLVAIAIDRLLKLQVQAERAAMQGVLGNLQSAMALTISEHIARDRIAALRQYVHSNPMALLASPPINYLGSFRNAPAHPEGASWWFEQNSNSLAYLVLNKDYFQAKNTKNGVIKFKIEAVYVDKNGNRRFDRHDELKGLQLRPTEPYRWLPTSRGAAIADKDRTPQIPSSGK